MTHGPLWLGAGSKPISGHKNFGLMAILNLTPDSFYDGGRFTDRGTALNHARELLDSGADILDIGAESTRPGAQAVSAHEECGRLLPVLAELRDKYQDAQISIDTRNAQTAARALELGAVIINDVSACSHDPQLMDVLAQYKPGYVLMHSQGGPDTMQKDPRYKDVVREVKNFFALKMSFLARAGLPEDRIVLDPGIGFGKTLEHNIALLANIREFLEFGRPLLVGLSMKSLLIQLLGASVPKRELGTAVATALLWQKGVFWHRVHEAGNACAALELAAALAKGHCN